MTKCALAALEAARAVSPLMTVQAKWAHSEPTCVTYIPTEVGRVLFSATLTRYPHNSLILVVLLIKLFTINFES